MKKIILFIISLLIINVVFAAQELNFTRQSEEYLGAASSAVANLRIASIRQDPFPANPGEYTEVYFKIENVGGEVANPKFELNLPYPLSVYPEIDKVKVLPSIASGEKITLNYKIKVDKNAILGNYESEFRAYAGSQDTYYPYFFNVKVEDVTTNFDVVLQEVTKDGASIAIANTGKNTANSITVRIENQEDFDLLGPSSYIIGNLNNGDYTILNVLVSPKENIEDLELKLQIDYTDTIGNRRTLKKGIPIYLNANIKRGFDELTGFAIHGEQKESSGGSGFMYISLLLLAALIAVIIYYRRKGKEWI